MYNFKKTSKVYIVIGSSKYEFEIYNDLNFSQVFTEESYRQWNLHEIHKLHDAAVIYKARPASFNFTIPMKGNLESNLPNFTDFTNGECIFFDLYFDFDNITYRIESCVVESAVFNFGVASVASTSFSGTGRKLEQFLGSIPGTLVTIPDTDYIVGNNIELNIGPTEVTSIINFSLEVNNDIVWVNSNTLNEVLAGNKIFPSTAYPNGRRISGAVGQNITEDNKGDFVDNNSVGDNMDIKFYSEGNNILTISLPSVVYTARENTDQLVTKTFDFRVISN